MRDVVVVDSVTFLDERARGAVVVTGSHGGRISASTALQVGAAGLVVHDASVGLDDAGIESLALLDPYCVPCVAVSAHSAEIGSGVEVRESGIVSHVNQVAAELGIRAGWAVSRAVDLMARGELPEAVSTGSIELEQPARIAVRDQVRDVWLLDSASYVHRPEHDNTVVVTGSHAALVGRQRAAAIKAPAFAAVFNDAGSANATRLETLEDLGIAAVTVGAFTARIGDAASSFATGTVSLANDHARHLGAEIGSPASEFVIAAARYRG